MSASVPVFFASSGSKDVTSTPAGRPRPVRTFSAASATLSPGVAATAAATSVVSGLTTFAAAGAASEPANGSPVDTSKPPIVRSVTVGSPKSKSKFPCASVFVQTSPSPGSHALSLSASIQFRCPSALASA